MCPYGERARLIRIGIVDDHPVFRLGLRRAFEREPDLAVAWDLCLASEVLPELERRPVDVILMDLNLGPNQDALATTRAIRERYETVKVIVVSALVEWEAAAASRNAGACGYLTKDLSIPDLVAAIRGLATDNQHRREFRDLLHPAHSSDDAQVNGHGLTPREGQVLGELRRGYTNREIASRLNISTTTVNKHVQQVLKKLQVRTRAQAVVKLHAEAAVRMYQSTGIHS